MTKKVFVTGGLGLIGSHLTEALLNLGNQVVILDNESTGAVQNLEHVSSNRDLKLVNGDILDVSKVESLMEKSDFCFHLAASLGVKKILTSPLSSYESNVHGTQNVLASASKYGVPVFLASTSEIYGDNPIQPLTEDSKRVLGSPLNIRWTYSEAKALDESLAKIYEREKGLRFIIGRFFNTVGPRQIGEYGMVLPRFVRSAMRDESIQVYGDGSQSRVFCHVDDAVEAMIRLIDEPKSYGNVFNIGGEGEISVKKLAELVIDVLNSKSNIELVPYEIAYTEGFEETYRRVPDTSKLRELTGWTPKRSLETTIKDIADYFTARN